MKQLKQRSLLFMLFLLAIAGLGLTSCSGDDLESNPSDNNSRFYVSVTDGGYFSTQDGIYTKSSEQGYTTEFTAGDQIGVFAVKNNQIIAEVNNLCLTATDNNGALVWKDAGGNAPLKFDGAVYYAYYPYQSSLTGTLVLTATDADSFFVNVVSNWTPSTDQGVYTKYTAQDLMTAQGGISNSELSFAMQHEMALAVIELPGTKYEFSNTNPSLPDYVIDPQDSRFDSYKPYKMADGMYRYLVRPGYTNKLTGSYTNASNAAKGWELNPAGISSGSYKVFKVDGGVTNIIPNYNLQIGDYMLKDGSLVSKDATLSPTQKANCVGVVYWIDPNGINHGKVVSLKHTMLFMWADINNLTFETGATDATNGFNNMKTIANLVSNSTKVWSNFPPFAEIHKLNDPAETYSESFVGRVWYLPSIDEWIEFYNIFSTYGQGSFNTLLTSAGGNSIGQFYWSSTEKSANQAYLFDQLLATKEILLNKNGGTFYVRGIAKF